MRTALAVAAALASCATVPERPSSPPLPDGAAADARCRNGYAVDCRELGRARVAPGAPERDDRLGAALIMQACELGDPAACSDLGVCYALGRGVAQSDERAAALSRRACEQGAAVACSNQGALLAEGAAGAAREAHSTGSGQGPEARSARIVRLFRTACDAGAPEGCANLATALEAGSLAVRDARAAARAFRRACDAGLALACHRLALLVGERPDVAPDLTATQLQARACGAGIAPACFAVSERTPPEGARTPAARLVDDRRSYVLGVPGMGGFSPGELSAVRGHGPRRTLEDVRRPPAALAAAVPAALRGRLGVDAAPRPAEGSDPPVELLVALRRHQLGQCYEAPRAARGTATLAYATFFVTADGRPLDVRAATSPPDPPLDACVADVVSAWEFPASPGGVEGPYLVRHEYEPAPAAAPAYAGPGSLRPALRDPGCVERELRVPPELRGSTGSVTVKVAVDPAGAPALLHAVAPAPDALLAAVAEAVGRCRWSPGADAEGRPASLWVTLTVKIDGR
jgi:TPR repeat protein